MTDINHNHPQHAAVDIGALALTVASFAGYLPTIAASLAVLWYCVLLYDRFFGRKPGQD